MASSPRDLAATGFGRRATGKQRSTATLSVSGVTLSEERDGWRRLDFTVGCKENTTRHIVACPRGPFPLVAGVVSTTDDKGREILLRPKRCYWCSNLGEPWGLAEIPIEGFSSSLFVKSKQAKQFSLSLLTDEGLEKLELNAEQ